LADAIGKREDVDIGELENGESNVVSRRYIADIVEARVEEILDKVDHELKKIDRSGKLPAGIVLTGGGAHMPQLVDAAKQRLRLPASLGHTIGVTSSIDKVTDVGFSTAVGLVLWGNQLTWQRPQRGMGTFFKKPFDSFKSISGKVRGLFGR